MANEKEPKTNRMQLTDLTISQQEITEEEMKKVQGGKEATFQFKKLPHDYPPPLKPIETEDPKLLDIVDIIGNREKQLN